MMISTARSDSRSRIGSAGLLIALILLGVAADGGQAQEADPEAPPFIATPHELVERMLSMAAVTTGDVVYDLGSGDGRLVIAAALRGARGVGVEYDPELVELSRAAAAAAGIAPHVEFVHQDLFETRLHAATVVTLYLGAEFNLRLRPRLLEQLRPGSRVVSHGFHMGDWQPDASLTLGSGFDRATLYLWIVPSIVDGFWFLEIEGVEPLTLELTQRFQELEGAASSDRLAMPIVAGAMAGESLRLELIEGSGGSARTFILNGRLEEGRLFGTVEGPAPWGGRTWRALRFNDPSRAPLGEID